jgi:hypothetical protein
VDRVRPTARAHLDEGEVDRAEPGRIETRDRIRPGGSERSLEPTHLVEPLDGRRPPRPELRPRTMPLYSYANFTIRSPLWMEELSPLPRELAPPAPDVRLSFLGTHPGEPPEGDWLHQWPGVGGDPDLSLGRTDRGLLLRFHGSGDFLVAPDLGLVEAWPAPETDAATLRHLILDQVLPRLLAHRERLVLHSAAVIVHGRAVAFFADTGGGKSTLAGSFHAAGYPLLTDDSLVITVEGGVPRARPTYPGLRLSPPAAAALFPSLPPGGAMARYSKHINTALGEEGPQCPLELAAVYLLRPEGPEDEKKGVQARAMTVRDACMALVQHSFLLDPTDVALASGLLDVAASVVAKCPAFALSYPRTFDTLPWVRARVLGHLRPIGESHRDPS